MAMASVTQSSSFESNKNSFRDASFSSYLNSSEETFLRKLGESNRDLTPVIMKQEDEEIGVFGAEKYFNGAIGDGQDTPRVIISKQSSRKYACRKEEDADHLEPVVMRPKVHGPPNARSESSWNSQSNLLNNLKKNPPSMVKNKRVTGKSLFGGFGCRCACSDKNSVDIEEQVDQISFGRATTMTHPDFKAFQLNKTNSDTWVRDKDVTKQIIESLGSKSKREKNHVRDIQRDVFGSPLYERRSKSLALDHKRPPILANWEESIATTRPRTKDQFSDCESDASSDLFEIESITCSKTKPLWQRQASEGTCYAPSEASIEWSVATASAADFSVCTSDYEETTTESTRSPVMINKTFSTTPYGEGQRRGPNYLLGCKSHEAARAAGDAFCRINEKVVGTVATKMRRKSDSCSMPMTRFPAEYPRVGFDSGHAERFGSAAPAIVLRSRLPHSSNLLYIQ